MPEMPVSKHKTLALSANKLAVLRSKHILCTDQSLLLLALIITENSKQPNAFSSSMSYENQQKVEDEPEAKADLSIPMAQGMLKS